MIAFDFDTPEKVLSQLRPFCHYAGASICVGSLLYALASVKSRPLIEAIPAATGCVFGIAIVLGSFWLSVHAFAIAYICGVVTAVCMGFAFLVSRAFRFAFARVAYYRTRS